MARKLDHDEARKRAAARPDRPAPTITVTDRAARYLAAKRAARLREARARAERRRQGP